MRIEECKKCKVFLDVSDAPPEAKIFYCADCFEEFLKNKPKPKPLILPLKRKVLAVPLKRKKKEEPIKIIKKKKKGKIRPRWKLFFEKDAIVFTKRKNAKIYKSKAQMPEGTWVTVEEASKYLNLSPSAIRARIGNDQYKMAHIEDGPLLIDLKSYQKKTYTRKERIDERN